MSLFETHRPLLDGALQAALHECAAPAPLFDSHWRTLPSMGGKGRTPFPPGC